MSEVNGYGNTGFKEKVSIDQVYLRQLDRTNITASYSYETSVLQKLNNLPMSWREWVEDQDDRYVEIKDTYIFETACGIRLGTLNDPCLRNPAKPVRRDENGDIDWTDPNIISPKMSREPYTDYSKLDAVIMEASEHAGLTWNQDTETFKIATITIPMSDERTDLDYATVKRMYEEYQERMERIKQREQAESES